MKICVLCEYFYPDSTGGTGTVLSSLLRRLGDSHDDIEIDVITSKNLFRGDGAPLPTREDWDGIHITRLQTPQPRKNSVKRRLAANMIFTLAAFRALLTARKKYDLVLVLTAPPTLPLAACLYSRLTRTPYVYLVYDLYLDLALSMNLLRADSGLVRRMRAVQKTWFHGASRVVVLGRCMRDYVASTYQVPSAQIEVVPIPGNVGLISPGPQQTDFRAKHNLSGFVALYAGNFAKYQDFDTLLDAAALLKDRRDITWAFVGEGTKRAHLCERVKREGLDNVRVFPFVPEDALCDLLASADVSLVTLEKEAAGLAVPSKFYNILASGRATVAVTGATSEIARVIAESDCGVRVAPENPQELARVVSELAASPERVKRMGENARRECEALYALPHIAHRFYALFERVLSECGTAQRGGQRLPVAAAASLDAVERECFFEPPVAECPSLMLTHNKLSTAETQGRSSK